MSLELAGIFGAGLLTFVTPCVLPLIPIYLALLLGQGSASTERGPLLQRLSLFISTLFFSLGLIGVFVAMGLTATSLGGLLAEHRHTLMLLGGLLIFLFGLKFLGALHIPWLEGEKRLDDTKLKSRFHLLNSLMMGVVFALGWTPCVGPILGSVLTYAASSASSPAQGALYLAAYGVGFTLPLLILSLFGDAARKLLRKLSPQLPRFERLSGAALALVGLYLMLTVGAPPTSNTAEATPTRAIATRATCSQAPSRAPLGGATERPRMVQFASSRCGICRQMIPTVSVIKKDCDGRRVDVLKIDVNEEPQLAKQYRVRGVPTFIFLDPKGSEVARLVGYQTLASLRQSLSAVTGQACDGVGLLPSTFPGATPAGLKGPQDPATESLPLAPNSTCACGASSSAKACSAAPQAGSTCSSSHHQAGS